MSDAAIAKGCIYHYDERHIQVRWDYYCLCAYDKSKFNQKLTKNGKKVKDEPNQECMAKILRLLETLTDREKTGWALKAMKLNEKGLAIPPEPKEFPIELSYSAISSLIYSSYGESIVRNSIAYLKTLGFIKFHQQTKNSIPIYILNAHVLQHALKKQAEHDLSDVEIDSQKDQVSKSTAKDKQSGVEIDSRASEIDSRASEIDSRASEIDTNNIYIRNNKKTSKKEECVLPPTPSLEVMDTSLSQEKNAEEKKPSKPRAKKVQPPTEKTPEQKLEEEPPLVQQIVREWVNIFTEKPITATLVMIEHARKLKDYKPEPGEIRACRLWMYKNDDNKWYSRRGMHLGDVAREFEKFRSLASIPEPKKEPVPLPTTTKTGTLPGVRSLSSMLSQLPKTAGGNK